MSTDVREGAPGQLIAPIVAASLAAVATAFLSREVPATLAAAGILGAVFVLVVRIAPLQAIGVLAIARATLEGWTNHVLVGVLGIGLSPPDVVTLGFMAGAGWWLVARARSDAGMLRAPTVLPTAVFLFVAGASLLYSPAPAVGARDLVKLAAAYCVYLVIVAMRPDARQLRALLGLVLVSAVVPIAVGWYQLANSIGHRNLLHGGLRIESTFDHPNTYGFYLVSVLAAAWGLRGHVSGIRRALVDAVAIAAFISTCLTLSRTAWVGLALLVFVVGLRHRRVWVTVTALAAGMVLAAPRLLQRVFDVFEPRVGSNRGNSLFGRFELWSEGIDLWKSQPLFGRGWGATVESVEQLTHNDFLRALVEAGLLGAATFVVFMFSVVKAGQNIAARGGELPRAFFGLTLAYVTVSVASNNLGKGSFQFYFWLLAGTALVWSQTMSAREPHARDAGAEPAPTPT